MTLLLILVLVVLVVIVGLLVVLARRVLAPGGRLVVQAGSPYFAPRAFGCVLAGVGTPPPLRLDPAAPAPRSPDAATLAAAATFPPDRRPPVEPPSTLDDPRTTRYAQDWRD